MPIWLRGLWLSTGYGIMRQRNGRSTIASTPRSLPSVVLGAARFWIWG